MRFPRFPAFCALLAATALTAFATSAQAQDMTVAPEAVRAAPADDFSGDTITIGVGAVYLTDYEGSDDYRLVPAPGAIGSYKGYGFTLAGNRLSVDLIADRPESRWNIEAGPIGLVNFSRSNRDSIDDRRIKALTERDTAIELGGYVGLGKTGIITSPYDRLAVSLSYRYDVSGVHKSGVLQPSINYLTPLSRKAAVGVYASAERVENGYGRAYYSVNAAESVASGLPVYRARGGWKNYSLGGFGTYSLTGDLLHGFKLVAGGSYSRQLNDFADSPVVSIAGSRNQWLGVVGLAYTF